MFTKKELSDELEPRKWSVLKSTGNWFLTVGLYVVLYLAVIFVVNLPLSFYQGYLRLHAYGLSNQTLGKWFGDKLIGLAVAMAVGFALSWVPYLLMARSPRRWWLYTGLLSVPFLFATMMVEPIWIDPLFNEFGPMKNQELERSILALAERAGINGSRVFEVEKSVDTNAVNAYVTGVLSTKRIVLWDTLLAKLDEPEVLAVMGHEMGHYVLGHVVRSILLGSLVVLAGLYFVDRAGRWLIARFSRAGLRPALRHRLGADGPHADRSGLAGLEPGGPRLQSLPGARGRPVRPGADPVQSFRRHGVRQAPDGEPGQPPPRSALQGLPGQPPEHRRTDRFLQCLSPVARGPARARSIPIESRCERTVASQDADKDQGIEYWDRWGHRCCS